MSDLESRLRRALAEHAASAPVAVEPPAYILASVRRRRRARLVATGATLALVGGLLAFVPTLAGDEDGQDVAAGSRAPGAGRLPPEPPVLAGSVVANSDGQPCPGACSAARFEIASPDRVLHVDTGMWSAATVLPDGRFVVPEGSGGGSMLIDPAGRSLPLGRDVNGLDVLPDGRLVVLATDDAGARVLRKIDPVSGSAEDRSLPSWMTSTAAVAAAPDGAVAVLATGDGCCDPSDLFVVAADGKEHRHRLSLPEGRRQTLGFPPAMSWGASGLIAITGSRPQRLAVAYYEGRRAPERDDPHPGWTNVVDAATGELVASLDGWQGAAWSPDGTGLLAARRDGQGASRLAVWWGPGLARRIDAGRTPVPVVPRYWGAG